MLKNIDEGIYHIASQSLELIGKSGYVKEDLFFQLLILHGVELSPDARTVIVSTYKKGDKINYVDAMPIICIDLETAANQQEQKWTIRKEDRAAMRGNYDTQSSVRSYYSRAKSVGQPNNAFKGKNHDTLLRIAEFRNQLDDKAAGQNQFENQSRQDVIQPHVVSKTLALEEAPSIEIL